MCSVERDEGESTDDAGDEGDEADKLSWWYKIMESQCGQLQGDREALKVELEKDNINAVYCAETRIKTRKTTTRARAFNKCGRK